MRLISLGGGGHAPNPPLAVKPGSFDSPVVPRRAGARCCYFPRFWFLRPSIRLGARFYAHLLFFRPRSIEPRPSSAFPLFFFVSGNWIINESFQERERGIQVKKEAELGEEGKKKEEAARKKAKKGFHLLGITKFLEEEANWQRRMSPRYSKPGSCFCETVKLKETFKKDGSGKNCLSCLTKREKIELRTRREEAPERRHESVTWHKQLHFFVSLFDVTPAGQSVVKRGLNLKRPRTPHCTDINPPPRSQISINETLWYPMSGGAQQQAQTKKKQAHVNHQAIIPFRSKQKKTNYNASRSKERKKKTR